MCLHHGTEPKPRFDGTPAPLSTTATIPRPGKPETGGTRSDQPLRYLLELDLATANLRIADLATGEVLADLDRSVTEELSEAHPQDLEPGFAALRDALFQRAAPPLAIEGGLAARALEEHLEIDALAAPRKTRRKLWELPRKLHCPVIGTCLDARELRGIARKAGVRTDGELSDYDVHVSFVAAADHRNSLSLAAHKALEKKFGAQVNRFSRVKTSAQLADLWEDALARGEVPGGLWATLTHPACDKALKARTYEAVHMLSHQIGAGQRADLKRLTEAEAELAALRRELESARRRQRRQLEEREQRVLELERSRDEAQQQRRTQQALSSQLQQEVAELRSRNTARQIDTLNARLADAEGRTAMLEQRGEALESALGMAEKEIRDLQAENTALLEEAAAMERFISRSLSICDSCEVEACDGNPDLGGRRVLCVGGRSRLIEQYRELVARCNGRFEHYDGGIEDNRQRLDALLSSADAVVCATDAVSHDAYYRLKRFCKRHEKPHVFLRGSGIGSFARALLSISG